VERGADVVSARLLVIDVGNTNVGAGVYEGRKLVASWRLSTQAHVTADEFSLPLAGLLERDGLDPRRLDAAVLSCVVPPLTDTIVRGLRRLCPVEPLVVRPGIRTGMPLLYDHPEEIGADRIVNAIAAFDVVKGAAIVVDYGTATSFDCVSEAGAFLGGAIAPGLGISAEALFRSAARLPRVEIDRPGRAIAKTTVSALQSGLFHGYVGLVDGLLDRLLAEMPEGTRVLATGGLAERLASSCRHAQDVHPNLTLEGLRLLHERNRR
jgi:type III pantothenate kinase